MGEARSASLVQLGEGGGGFIGEDKDVILDNLRFITAHQFKKKTGEDAGKPSTVLAVDIKVKDPDDADHAESTQYYTVGDPEHFKASSDNKTPSDEGGFIVLTGTFDSIWAKSAYGQFISELLSIGLDPALLANGVQGLNGIDVHLVGKAQPKGKNAPADAKERKILVVSKINSLPGEKAAGGAKSAPGAKTAAAAAKDAPPAAASGDIDEKAQQYVIAALKKEGASLTKKQLGQKVFGLANAAKEGKALAPIAKRVTEDEFLAGLAEAGVMFTPENGEVLYIGE